MDYEEFEVIRLSAYAQLSPERIANILDVHRSTVSRMLAVAHSKIAEALTENKSLHIRACC